MERYGHGALPSSSLYCSLRLYNQLLYYSKPPNLEYWARLLFFQRNQTRFVCIPRQYVRFLDVIGRKMNYIIFMKSSTTHGSYFQFIVIQLLCFPIKNGQAVIYLLGCAGLYVRMLCYDLSVQLFEHICVRKEYIDFTPKCPIFHRSCNAKSNIYCDYCTTFSVRYNAKKRICATLFNLSTSHEFELRLVI